MLTVQQAISQPGQLSISRVTQMPDLPAPLQIRDWQAVTVNYDSYVFDLDKIGQYLPLSRLGTQGQFNYPDNTPLFMDSYVGSAGHLNHAEAINILPAIIGASLAGVDKSSQGGMNWVAMAKDFFNLKNGQDVYLNNYFATSGSDWWYDLMPNVYFYQLRSMYPDAAPEFDSQFISVADRWLFCVRRLGGGTTPWTAPYMNYRAFNLATGMPLTTGVPEPESAGSIAWLLYHAYSETGDRKYFEGAQLAMEFLEEWENNPSYELQLSYGTLVAARMNAVEGTTYPLQKMLDWCFDRGALRDWGAIVGSWGGYDVSGLIGEANDGGNDYAFVMNGFQQAAALAPLPKYDKRYARDIAKWLLNVTNASRLFYWNALPESHQDSYAWASANDPQACIPYESMKEVWQGKSPFARGDAIAGGWAATNLSLYSGSSVGYLAAVVKTTNVPEILQIDLNKTDFYGDNVLPSYLYFNPLQTVQQIQVILPDGTYGIYETLTETILHSSASGTFMLNIPAGEARLIRMYPAVEEPEPRNGRLYIGEYILDYYYGYNYSGSLRIKSLSTEQRQVIVNTQFPAWCEPGNVNPGDPVQYEWYLDDIPVVGQYQSPATLTAPASPSNLIIKCRISANGQSAEDTLHLQVVEYIPSPPVVHGIQAGAKYTAVNETNTFTALADPAPGDILQFAWSASIGALQQTTGSTVTWLAPASPTAGTITVEVTNQDLLSTTVTAGLLVKDTTLPFQNPLIWYPFDTDDKNMAADRFHATASGVTKTADARGKPASAYRFTSGQNIIYTDNHEDLNFSDAISMSCWLKCEMLGSERFVISHGSWQQRYKLSVTPEGHLRWTVKTETGVADLDSSNPIELNRYYHVTTLYTGYSMELYIDGEPDTFSAFSGPVLTSTKPLTIGRMDNTETLYSWRGSIDEVKIWDREIPIPQVRQLKDHWATPFGIRENEIFARVYPNPATNLIFIEFTRPATATQMALFASDGRKVNSYSINTPDTIILLEIPELNAGIYALRVVLKDGSAFSRKIIIR